MMIMSRGCFLAQSLVLLLMIVASAKTTSVVAAASELSLGAIVMQLRSSADSDSVKLSRKIQSVMKNYLNEYFGAYYESTEPDVTDYFSHVTLSIKSFGVHGVNGKFVTTLEIEGSLLFNSDTLPSSFFIDTLLKNAFQGYNEQLFLKYLTKGGDEEQFLKELAYLVVDVNGGKVSESRIQGEALTNIPDHSTTVGGAVGETNSNNNDKGGQIGFFTQKWVMIFVYSVIGILASALILSYSFYIFRRCSCHKEETKTDGGNEEPMKVISLPVKMRQQQQPSNRGLYYNRKLSLSTTVDNDRISPSTLATTKTVDSISDHMDRPPPSPQRSMTSQVSSKFTYTDNMSKCVSLGGDKYLSVCNIDFVPSIDSTTRRGLKPDPPAFGQDISIIENENNHDLTLIQECEEDSYGNDVEIGFYSNNQMISDNPRYLARNSRTKLDGRQSKARLSSRSESYFYGNYEDEEGDGGNVLDTSTKCVISDLRNLSVQIERERILRKSNRTMKS